MMPNADDDPVPFKTDYVLGSAEPALDPELPRLERADVFRSDLLERDGPRVHVPERPLELRDGGP
eukprot:4806530-Pyramimonas_sp.AAC.1